ncbi:NYN domain-containing protein [Agromyces chitinivorans]|uniref:NYN domain-containing protein n=1 Tax=Agromyces chitinivorans TaxID=3158560 RepID=UPI003398D659
MPTTAEPRVAIYLDFDNIVISRYDQLHGDLSYRRDTGKRSSTAKAETATKLQAATVDVDAVLDFAATFGTIAVARAYADWSNPVNASYRGQLIDRAVDLVQLFPLSATKNGADIRLAVDAVEDLFRLDDLTHVVIVAGDSDYVALAQRCKRLSRYVVGIGVAGGTSRALTAACDEFADYDALLQTDADVDEDERAAEEDAAASKTAKGAKDASGGGANGRRKANGSSTEDDGATASDAEATPSTRNPGRLLIKALELLRAKNDEEWQPSGSVKNQMLRMDPGFQERRLGFGSFTDFLKSRGGVVELDETTGQNRVRIRPRKG